MDVWSAFQIPRTVWGLMILPNAISPPPSLSQSCVWLLLSRVRITQPQATVIPTFLNCLLRRCQLLLTVSPDMVFGSAKLDQLLLPPQQRQDLQLLVTVWPSSWRGRQGQLRVEMAQTLTLSSKAQRLLLNLCLSICYMLWWLSRVLTIWSSFIMAFLETRVAKVCPPPSCSLNLSLHYCCVISSYQRARRQGRSLLAERNLCAIREG